MSVAKTAEGDHTVRIKRVYWRTHCYLLGSENSSPAGKASGLSRVPEDLKADPFLSGDFFFFLSWVEQSPQAKTSGRGLMQSGQFMCRRPFACGGWPSRGDRENCSSLTNKVPGSQGF